jgi:predicted adenine nucleotide alpha hydrolase (AANH) superfamily ATPase
MKLLLHCCCAPCTVQCAEGFIAEGLRPDLFWYNPNIHPFTEYKSRRDALVQYAAGMNLPLSMRDEYGLRSFIRGTADAMDGGRCFWCYRTRLEAAARGASEGGYEYFSTTLLISPYQNHEAIRKIADELAEQYGIPFLYRDFRPRFREGQGKARDLGLYMQKYCGCIFSEEERYLQKRETKKARGLSGEGVVS